MQRISDHNSAMEVFKLKQRKADVLVERENRENKRFPSSQRPRRGLTRLELLLVLSVIFLNGAIFLPFVQQAREAARQSQCQGNLKQVGLAIANYVDVYDCFPSGFDVSPEGNYLGRGWNLKILPYMNMEDLYNSIEPHFAKGIHGLPDASQFKPGLPSLRCPSDNGTETVPHAMVVTAKVVDGIVRRHARTISRNGRIEYRFADEIHEVQGGIEDEFGRIVGD